MFKKSFIDQRCINCKSTVEEESKRKDNQPRPNDCSFTEVNGQRHSNCPYATGQLKR